MPNPSRAVAAERPRSGWRALRNWSAASLALVALVGGLVAPDTPAEAVDEYGFPTWAEVEAARGNEAAKNEQIANIRALIAQLETDLANARAFADQKAAEAIEAQRRYDEAVAVADRLQEQADEALARAEESELAAGQLAAQLARTGGTGDMSAELFANPGSADSWLYRLDLMDRVAGTADSLYERAQQDSNTARSLQEQAEVAREVLLGLKEEADAAFAAATDAAAAAEAAVVMEQNHRVELETQLKVLVENRVATEDDYQAGQAYRAWLAEQERLRLERERREREEAERKAREEAARLAAIQAQAEEEARRQAAARAASSGGSAPAAAPAPASSGGGGTVPVAPASSSGWVTPHYGRFTSAYGWRNDPVGVLGRKLHAGMDIAAGCGTPIFAVADGMVTLRSYDIYGANMLYINHGNGVQSEYFHMIRPAHVAPGQFVAAGQVVAYEGSTGHSTGCHLHFQMRVNGTLVNPETFLNARGVALR